MTTVSCSRRALSVLVLALSLPGSALAQTEGAVEENQTEDQGTENVPFRGDFETPAAPETTDTAPMEPAPASTAGRSYASSISDKRETFGSVMAPAAMPSGAQAAYGYLGVQEVGGGYRQGIGDFEIEGRARFNYLLVSLGIEAVGKWAVVRNQVWDLAPYLGLGFVFDTGARYFDVANFSHVGLKLLGGVTATYRFTETVRGVANLEIPYDFSLAMGGGNIFNPLIGGGAEIYLGNDISALGLASIGVLSLKEPLGVPAGRVGYQIRLGLGYRFF